MDPYLERFWLDVHHRLITYASDQIQPKLPEDLRARAGERVFVASLLEKSRDVFPDVYVVERGRYPPLASGPQGVLVAADPLVIETAEEPLAQGFVEIIEAGSGGRVVTLIEFVSPSNKAAGDGRRLYLKKRKNAMAGGANVVEVDLTRDGDRESVFPLHLIRSSHRTTYLIFVRRASSPGKAEVYRAPLVERLPVIRVPLRTSDADVLLDLQDLVERAYENGRYDDLDYGAELDLPLSAGESAWTADLLRARGLRR
jgi:hypothetical protein